MKQQHYSAEFKEQAIAKVFGRSKDQSVESIADDLNMSKGTLRNWMKVSMRAQRPAPVSARAPSEWQAEDRLLALQESHGLAEEALNAWCRGRGIFAHDLTQWRSDFCEAAGVASRRAESEELRQLRLANLQLQRDLNRKDKALAEAAALLVLQNNIGRCGRPRTHERRGTASFGHGHDRRGGYRGCPRGAGLRSAGLQ